MDLAKDIVLKENYTFLVADSNACIGGGDEHGIYNRDTRFLNRYEWVFDRSMQTLYISSPQPDSIELHYAEFAESFQTIGVRRFVTVTSTGVNDRLIVENTSQLTQTVTLTLLTAADFVDMFEARQWHAPPRKSVKSDIEGSDALVFRYTAADGLRFASRITADRTPTRQDDGCMSFEITLEPAGRTGVDIDVALETPLEDNLPGIDYELWRAQAPRIITPESDGVVNESIEVNPLRAALDERVLRQAVDDLRALLLFTIDGPVPAAGIPWFVSSFGRDSLLTSMFLLRFYTEPTEATVRHLARYQATETDSYRAATPGKIMHELRFGELSRTGKVPFGPYYGTIDSTSLYLMLLGELLESGLLAEPNGEGIAVVPPRSRNQRPVNRQLIACELRSAWEAAVKWIDTYGDADGDGLQEYAGSPAGSGLGLPIQSWKDSDDSMSHADGLLADGPICPCEVQGYAYAAMLAGARLYEFVGEDSLAARQREAASELQDRFHRAFWIDDLGTYAMALDGRKRPLAVKSSNVGHLLWTGIVPTSHAERVRDSLFSDELWTGWGFRTLGSRERRYNPLSYHNGSVWPHDTAIAAAGLARYGFRDEARRIRFALFDLAASQADWRLPELVAGYQRGDGPPIPYPVACRPQAWDAAALLYLLQL